MYRPLFEEVQSSFSFTMWHVMFLYRLFASNMIVIWPSICWIRKVDLLMLNSVSPFRNTASANILSTSNRIPTKGQVVMYNYCHGATFVMTNCTIVSQKCSPACYHVIWCHNSTNWYHNGSTMTTCNRKYTWLPCIQQQMLFEVLRIMWK